MLEKNEKHALPWCLVIGVSKIARPDPNLSLFSRLDSVGFFESVFRILLILLNIEEFGIGMRFLKGIW